MSYKLFATIDRENGPSEECGMVTVEYKRGDQTIFQWCIEEPENYVEWTWNDILNACKNNTSGVYDWGVDSEGQLCGSGKEGDIVVGTGSGHVGITVRNGTVTFEMSNGNGGSSCLSLPTSECVEAIGCLVKSSRKQ